MAYTVLVIDDDPFQCKTTKLALEKMLNYEVETLTDGNSAIELLLSEEGRKIDLVILDLSMPEVDGIDVLKKVCPEKPDLPIIINTAYGDIKKAVEALKLGAVDFIEKQDGFERIKICIENVRLRSSLTTEVKKLHKYSKNIFEFDDIIGSSTAIMKTKAIAKKASLSNIPVYIYGESGVGKELFARAIHASSIRRNKPFISINCSAIPSNLVESLLFGHEKGAFTGAIEKSLGKFRDADGGTLFLDEVGELPLDIQPKLLRALQNFEIEPVGSSKTYDVNVRIISATNKNLEKLVSEGKFREDLYYRLNVFQLNVPNLKERREDIYELTEYFVNKICVREGMKILKIDEQVPKLLAEYWWPGNVRQLENAIHKAVVVCCNETLTITDFDSFLINNSNIKSSSYLDIDKIGYLSESEPKFKTLNQHEKDIIEKALEFYNWNISKVSKVLDVGRSTLYRKMKEYGIEISGNIEDIEEFRKEESLNSNGS